MSRIEIIGVYPVDSAESCHLVEMIIHDCKGKDVFGSINDVPFSYCKGN